MRTLPRLLLAASLLLAVQATGRAQCAPVPGTGCPLMPAPTCSGAPISGTTISVGLPAPLPVSGHLKILVVGYAASGAVDFYAPLTCTPGPCRVGVDMGLPAVPIFVGVSDPQIPLPLGMAGLSATFQWFEIMAPTNCLILSQAMTLTIQ